MDFTEFNVFDIEKYNPYDKLREFIDDEYFEDKYLEYYDSFKGRVEEVKNHFYNMVDEVIDKLFYQVVVERNTEEVNRIINKYSSTKETNEADIALLKSRVRKIKDIILATEESNVKRLEKIDRKVSQVIDRGSNSFSIDLEIRDSVSSLIDDFNSYVVISSDDYGECVSLFREKIKEICDSYRKNYSVKTASFKIRELKREIDLVIDSRTSELGFFEIDRETLEVLIWKYRLKFTPISVNRYDEWLFDFKRELDQFKKGILKRYSDGETKRLIKLINREAGILIDEIAIKAKYPEAHACVLDSIFNSYVPENLDIFDYELYGSLDERDAAISKYEIMSFEERHVFEMRMYDQYVRNFKRRIREFNKDVRMVYSLKYANRYISYVNRKADKLIRDKASEIGRPVPSNPWFIRKYLWADTTNFVNDMGLKFRRCINPVIREIIKLGMDNKIVIEERPQLDPMKQYIFVSTHYFTEDVIGLFSSVGRQAHMLMGTTDQIENNPLMIFAVLLGFFHLDRMDSTNRIETFEKQNELIEHGTSFINYVAGSWENSENELQPLSFSGPYRTGKLKNVEIVPVGSYLVEEDKKMYVRFGEPLDLSQLGEDEANEIIRDTLATIHYKQLEKHSKKIGSVNILGYGVTHNLPYDQHTYYMNERGNEYWNQPWSRPFAKEEIGIRSKKDVTIENVYEFVSELSRERLIELSSHIAEPMYRMDEKERYDIVSYLDNHYDEFKKNNDKSKKKVKKQDKIS